MQSLWLVLFIWVPCVIISLLLVPKPPKRARPKKADALDTLRSR